jgi:hypothetical protein
MLSIGAHRCYEMLWPTTPKRYDNVKPTENTAPV